jgi:hypothetical protein
MKLAAVSYNMVCRQAVAAGLGVPAVSGTQQTVVIPSERSEPRNLAVVEADCATPRRDSSLSLGMTMGWGLPEISVAHAGLLSERTLGHRAGDRAALPHKDSSHGH